MVVTRWIVTFLYSVSPSKRSTSQLQMYFDEVYIKGSPLVYTYLLFNTNITSYVMHIVDNHYVIMK